MRSFSFLKQPCQKTYPVVKKMFPCFRNVKLMACTKQRQQLRRLLEVPKTLKCQRIRKTWKDSDEPSKKKFSQMMRIVIRDNLNVWWNQMVKKSTVKLTTVFNSERASPQTQCKENPRCYKSKKWGQLTIWILNDQVFPLVISSLMARHIWRWQSHDSSGSNCERVAQGAFWWW